jgi:two-component system, chemotaxis family, chemotaxis protein CheY
VQRVKSDPTKQSVGKTVLIVDDNAPIRKMIAAAFLLDGFETCGEAGNGKEGIEVAKQIKPDLITLDLSMPIMNGLEAAFELRKTFPKIPMILFTMYGNEHLKPDASKVGISLVLPKSVPLRTLVEKAHELMDD